MFHKLLIIACLLGANFCNAQSAVVKPPSAPEKIVDSEIDYKLVGAPMPLLKILKVVDTAKKKDTASSAMYESRSRKMKKQEEEEERNPYILGDDLDNGANFFVMMFNPTCSHCMDETMMIEKNISLFNKSKWVMIANPTMRPYMGDFIKQMHVRDYQPFYIGTDSSGFLNKVYRYGALPQINIYDRDRKLIKIFNGEVEIDSLKPYIQ